MSDNLTNEIKTSLFADGSVTVTTTGGDISASLVQPKQYDGMEKYNLDQRDDLTVVLHSVSGTVASGAILTAKYYNRVPNQISDSILLATEAKTLAAISAGAYIATDFTDAAIEYADYFTLECTLKQASGSAYTVTGNVIVKKKSDLPTVKSGIAAPTTATVGMQGDIIYDTNNNKWTMIAKVGSNYMWSPEGFPAVNTEYASHIEGGVVVWKFRFSGLSGATTSATKQALGLSGPVSKVLEMVGSIKYDGGDVIAYPLPAFNFSTSVNGFGCYLADLTTVPAVATWASGTQTQSKPFILSIYYTKA